MWTAEVQGPLTHSRKWNYNQQLGWVILLWHGMDQAFTITIVWDDTFCGLPRTNAPRKCLSQNSSTSCCEIQQHDGWYFNFCMPMPRAKRILYSTQCSLKELLQNQELLQDLIHGLWCTLTILQGLGHPYCSLSLRSTHVRMTLLDVRSRPALLRWIGWPQSFWDTLANQKLYPAVCHLFQPCISGIIKTKPCMKVLYNAQMLTILR